MARAAAPLWVWVDVSATCNLHCSFCYTHSMRSRDKMSIERFAQISDRLLASRRRIVKLHLNWRGEPSSNPDLPLLIAQAAARWPDLELEWHTNGTLIGDERARALVDASPRQLIFVSIDGGTAASFESTRGPGTWPRALGGLEALLRARGSRARPRIGIYQLDLGVAQRDYDRRFVELAARVDKHCVVAPIGSDGDPGGDRHAAVPHGPCFWLGATLAVDARGTAHTCLLEGGSELGSLLEHDADELLDRAERLRARVAHGGRGCVTGCASCHKPEGSPAAEPAA